jgi:hypothetical protein
VAVRSRLEGIGERPVPGEWSSRVPRYPHRTVPARGGFKLAGSRRRAAWAIDCQRPSQRPSGTRSRFHLGSGFIEPEAESCREGDGSPEGVSAPAMSDIDVPPAPWVGRTCSRAVGAADRAVRETRSNAGRDAPIGQGLPQGNGTASALVSRKWALRGWSMTAAPVLVSLACSTLKCSVRKAASTRSVGS